MTIANDARLSKNIIANTVLSSQDMSNVYESTRIYCFLDNSYLHVDYSEGLWTEITEGGVDVNNPGAMAHLATLQAEAKRLNDLEDAEYEASIAEDYGPYIPTQEELAYRPMRRTGCF